MENQSTTKTGINNTQEKSEVDVTRTEDEEMGQNELTGGQEVVEEEMGMELELVPDFKAATRKARFMVVGRLYGTKVIPKRVLTRALGNI